MGFFKRAAAAKAPAPTEEAEKFLADHGVPYTRRDDGSLFIPGDLNLDKRSLMRLPDLSRVEVGRDFSCDDNLLLSLRGAPGKVGGIFSCRRNKLTSLEGAPADVPGVFSCSDNPLNSLDGGPTAALGYRCDGCGLKSLKGAPAELDESFDCARNQLKNFEGGPRSVGGDMTVSGNAIASLQGAPLHFGRFISDFGTFTTPEGLWESASVSALRPDFGPFSTALDAPLTIRRPLTFGRR